MFTKRSSRFRPQGTFNQILFCFVLPLASLLMVAWVDAQAIKGFNILPLAATFMLMILSFSVSARWMKGWALLFCLSVPLVLWMKRDMWAGSQVNIYALMTTRTLSLLIVGILACFLATMREQHSASRTSLKALLDQLGGAVILSNEDGWIVYTNGAAEALFPERELSKKPYFDHFFPVRDKGKAIQRYLDLISGNLPGPVSIHFSYDAEKNIIFPATLMRLEFGSKKNILTLIHPDG